MLIQKDQLYHIYNQGNNREIIFKEDDDYFEFLNRFKKNVNPYCKVVSDCLMPNHFHFLINTSNKSILPVKLGTVDSTQLANGFRLLCSGYANNFNKKYGRSGSLFRQMTKAKELESKDENYPFNCFHYLPVRQAGIHQNPMRAGLCERMEDWEFSSFNNYYKYDTNSFLVKDLAFDVIGVSKDDFYNESYQVIEDYKIKKILEE